MKTIVLSLGLIIAAFFVYQKIEHNERAERIASMERIEAQRIQEQRKAEQEALAKELDENDWAFAQTTNTISAYERYRKKHPKGYFVDRVEPAIQQLKKEAEEKRLLAQHTRKAQQLVQLAGQQIIKNVYHNGINKNVVLDSWKYSPNSSFRKGHFELNVTMTWNGDFIASNYYKTRGVILINEDGSGLKWQPTYMNETLTTYIDDFNELFLGTVIVLGSLEALSEQ